MSLLSMSTACVGVPSVEAVQFSVDNDQLADGQSQRELTKAARALDEDPDLHLLVIGHADEDNTDEYNRALSRRRAEYVRERIVALAPEFGARVHVEARGEWDASDPGSDEEAKARNRRAELRFYYPRRCEPSFDTSFLACEWARLPEPEPEPEPEPPAPPPPESPAAESTPAKQSLRDRQDFRGPYVFGLGGYAISSAEYLRQHGRWGLGAGYLWGFDEDFRLALGLNFDHLVDVGFLFPQTDSCTPFCAQVDRSQIRVVPELRVGGIRGGLWGWLRLSAGLVLHHHEAQLRNEPGQAEPIMISGQRWDPGVVFGIGPGIAITLTDHLFLLFDATVTYSRVPGVNGGGGGSGIYDAGAGLGWIF